MADELSPTDSGYGKTIGIGSNAITQAADNSGNTSAIDNLTRYSTDFFDINNPVGNTNFNYTIPGAYTSTGLTNTNGTVLDTVKSLFTDKDGNLNLQALGALGGGLAGLAGAMNKTTTPSGYQGGIPELTATRHMIQAPPTKEQGYRPGAGGIDYGGDVTYTRTPGVDSWANLNGFSGTSAGANLGGLGSLTPGGTRTITPGSTVIPGGTKTVVPGSTVVPARPIIPNETGSVEVKPKPPTPPNLGSTGYQNAIKAGLTPAQYLNNINQWILNNPRASRDQIDAALKQYGVSDTDLQEALRTTNFSDSTKYGLTHGMGLQEINNNITNWIAAHPYATNDQIQAVQKQYGVNDEDVARAMNGLNSSAGKEYAVVHDMGLDQLYKNILDYQAAGHTPTEIANVMSQYGIEQRDVNNANKYATSTGYTANPTSYAGVGDYSNLGGGSTAASNTAVSSGGGESTAVNNAAVNNAVVNNSTASSGGTNQGLDTSNSIYQYFARPETQAALASGDTRGIAETMQALGYSPADVAAATGTNVADVQAAYDAALGGGTQSYDPYSEAFAEGGMAKGRYLQGGTDGMADKIPAQIGASQPAALSHGEFVIPADVVSHMGNGNSDAGAKKLYQMMDKIRMARTGTKQQGKKINPDKFMPGGLANSKYARGGSVRHFDAGGGISGVGTAANAGVTGTESALSNWVGPYTTNMLGQGQALANAPYQAYMGPLTAGESPLQTQAFGTAANLTTPTSIGDAATQAGNISTAAQGLKYTPNTSSFDTTQAQAYMNPYLEASLKPQLEEARRQSLITQQGNAAKMTQAGAFGGSRQAILDAETQRNLGTNLANITGTGYNTAYNNAQTQFNADQQRKMAENQYGAGYGLQGLQTGLQAAQAQGVLGGQENQIGLANLAQQLAAGQQQRGIESEGIAADKAQFEEARANPYKMVQFQQSLLQGLPTSAQNINMAQPSTLQQILAGAGGVAGMFPTAGTTGAQDLAAALKKLGIG